MDQLHDRLRIARRSLQLTQNQVASKIGANRSTVCIYESGNRIPGDNYIDSFCRNLRINKEWLVSGTGEMTADPNDDLAGSSVFTLQDRLLAVRRLWGMTQKELGEILGVTSSTVSFFELGKSNPNQTYLMLLCLKFDINMDWLLTGKLPMMKSNSNSLKQLAQELSLSDSEMLLIRELLNLDADERRALFSSILEITKNLLPAHFENCTTDDNDKPDASEKKSLDFFFSNGI